MAISKLKKIFSYFPLFCWYAVIIFLLYHAIEHAHLSGEPLFTGEDYIGYALVLFTLSFPLGSLFIFILSLVGFGDTAFFNPFSAFTLTIFATLGFYIQWYMFYPKLRKAILRKYFNGSENYFIFDVLIFVLIVLLVLSTFSWKV
ncbi:hypothetical protein [Rodentibacter sp. Ppn85]|uniref:hypothetical protein n=1 Tax=Rodentibacter sp. Ppn85 TaxID=1908525 RepID=UPI0009867152|nr:hypothetical protein [Rodentibacter sp. Ppn85]OOF65569.1 hypothetical protein BKL51_05055 [Rodentibacter sp. Ppn85]